MLIYLSQMAVYPPNQNKLNFLGKAITHQHRVHLRTLLLWTLVPEASTLAPQLQLTISTKQPLKLGLAQPLVS